ncbi:hypothetical protein EMPS_01032 [Entomortierella parvispora]|uniref:Mitochondrial carrier protein n=1 Tax=Entomortierella parvispora TaxID=205924 RepID=A0A9P3H230_9FUNG|nr:hypothetical protein EMPS_01032 [Entomortierella parvispora]
MVYELPPIGHALSGGVAAALANLVIYPLDMATTRVQSQSTSSTSGSASSKSLITPGSNSQDQQQQLPIEFKRPGLPATSSSSSSSSATTSSVSADGKKKITKTIVTTTTTTRTLASSSTSASARRKVHYTSVPDAIRQIYFSEGFSALYSGLGSDTVATLTSNFVYFYVYMALRQRKEHRRKSGQLSTFQELFLGAEAGIISRFFTAPIHVVTTRQQVMGKDLLQQKQKQQLAGNGGAKDIKAKVSARSIIREIYAQDGITGFWAGYAPTVILSINPSITYFLFETIKKSIVARQTQALARSNSNPSKSLLAAAASLTSIQIFFISAFSKAIASFLTYPLILTKTKLQTKERQEQNQGNNNIDGEGKAGEQTQEKGFNGISDVFKTVIRDKGISGLYTGCQGQVVKGFFSFGLMYMIKDRVVAWMLTVFLAIHNMRNRVTSS